MKKMLACFGMVAALGLTLTGYAQAQSVRRAGSSAQPHGAQLPVFSFLGDNTEVETHRTELNGEDCKSDGALLSCADYNSPTIAEVPLKWLRLDYNNKKLYRLSSGVAEIFYPKILAALSQKYGAPKATTEEWKSKGGGTFQNSVATWNFKGGQLRYDSLGTDLSTSLISFRSSINSPPEKAPVVDF